VKLSKMRDTVITTEVEWLGQTVEVGVRPGLWTQEVVDGFRMQGEVDADDSAYESLATVIAWWDVLDADDERIPVTVENLRAMPVLFLARIPLALAEAIADSGKA
jgi:hypothetical protein